MFDLPRTVFYDGAGNLVDDGSGKSFEWDAANRLIAINYNATGNRTEFAYDGLGRRVKITEYGPGVTADVQPEDNKYTTFSAGPFTLTSGVCTLTLRGLNSRGGDNTILVDGVRLNNVLLADGSFEHHRVDDYLDNPTDTAWSFLGSTGVARNGGSYTSDNPAAPQGDQVAFIRNTGSLSQSWNVSGGKYKLQFEAAQRGSGNDDYQTLRVNLRSAASVISAKTFVWCGNQICEERDGTGANVTKRFFAEGEQRVGGTDAGNYYYTRDHLGSIREVTDWSGVLKARYDYDPYGNRIVLSGQMDTDFGYTGHYFHAPSGLNLTLYRAYDPKLGRWISRDPIGEDGGMNLYGYVANDPLRWVDPLGLCRKRGEGVWDCLDRYAHDFYGSSLVWSDNLGYYGVGSAIVGAGLDVSTSVVTDAAENAIKDAPLAGVRAGGTILERRAAGDAAARAAGRIAVGRTALVVVSRVIGVTGAAATGWSFGARLAFMNDCIEECDVCK